VSHSKQKVGETKVQLSDLLTSKN